jgi:hypothetical protein
MSTVAKNGRCGICRHPERTRLELLLAGGASLRSLSEKFSVNRENLRRHYALHVDAERKVALTFGPVQRAHLESHLAEEAESVIDHYRAVRAGLYALYDAAVTAGDRTGGALVAGRLLTCLDSMAKITGQMLSSPLVVNNTQNVFLNDPGFAAFQSQLVRVLRGFPEARAAVIKEFEKLESAPTEAAPGVTYDNQAA